MVLRLRDADAGTADVVEPQGRRTPLSEVGARSWWDQVGWLDQDPVLVPGTLRHNAILFTPRRRPGRARTGWTEAAVAAGLRPGRGGQLPAGWDTVVGRDGVGLSAGQRQRLALVRVLLADAPLVVLDEPTAHLDGVNEQVVARTRWTRCGGNGRTVLLVSHRPALAAHGRRRVLSLPAAVQPEVAR